jgi:hypothetical protein
MTSFASPSLKSTAVVLLLSISALLHGQGNFAEFPYNPDADGDDFIGISDLLSLLSLYESSFTEEGLYVNDDTTEAVYFAGNLNLLDCISACKDLPGRWQLPTIDLLPLCLEHYQAPGGPMSEYTSTLGTNASYNIGFDAWASRGELELSTFTANFSGTPPNFYFSGGMMYPFGITTSGSAWSSPRSCYCGTKESPKVEYEVCEAGNGADFNTCTQSKIEAGWFPAGGISRTEAGVRTQAFWRWAE